MTVESAWTSTGIMSIHKREFYQKRISFIQVVCSVDVSKYTVGRVFFKVV